IYTFSHLQDEAFYRNIYRWFQLSAEPMKILTRPWTVLTMPFTELKLLMVVSNLIWLWTFGFLVQDLIGDDKLFPAYLDSALVGGLGFVLTAQVGFTELVESMYF
ncbi:MAG: rhomboid family intramembrane serine protease, partial [bacterium]